MIVPFEEMVIDILGTCVRLLDLTNGHHDICFGSLTACSSILLFILSDNSLSHAMSLRLILIDSCFFGPFLVWFSTDVRRPVIFSLSQVYLLLLL